MFISHVYIFILVPHRQWIPQVTPTETSSRLARIEGKIVRMEQTVSSIKTSLEEFRDHWSRYMRDNYSIKGTKYEVLT